MSAFHNISRPAKETAEDFKYFVDQFEDIQVLKYKLPGFDSLSLPQKILIYYLGEASLCGRDILWEQNFKYNLLIRKTFEAVLNSYPGDRKTPEYKAFLVLREEYVFCKWYSSSLFK